VSEYATDLMLQMYRCMVLIRLAEEKLADLVEAGEIGTPCHLYIGQEAIAAGVCSALSKADYVWGAHRSHGHYLAKGGDLRAMMAEIYGKTTGCSKGHGGSMHLCAPEVGILGTVPLLAATIPLATGSAFASKTRGDQRVSVSFFGDGATEEGHFHESLNLAGLYRLPLVFVCENNLYACHMHISERRSEDNIVKSAEAHGINGAVVDGNDALAVYRASVEAVARARAGGGPTLIECRTYRWRGHVGPSWDSDVGVKRRGELKEWLPKDPILRLSRRLIERGVSEEVLETAKQECEIEVSDSIKFARESPSPDPSEMLAHVR
jgi:acetoin:2,6-dichlorophenolindophenol oxidoreductase subunit alpha